MKKLIIAAAFTIASTATLTMPANANAFLPWEVTNLEWNDVLNIRKHPSAKTEILDAIANNGAPVSLTGACTNDVDVRNSDYLPKWKMRKLVRYEWCQIVSDTGEDGVVTGWVYGRYIRPQ